MLLFLDVISPIPEFFIIEDNKVIFQRKIIKNDSDKLSDNIFEVYIKINKDLNLSKNIKKTAMTIGPGSYTSLRVGAAFLSGLLISQNLTFCPISMNDFFSFKSIKYEMEELGFFISSSKNQYFFCNMNREKKITYTKLENNDFIIPKKISTIFYNFNKLNQHSKKINQNKLSIIDELINNYERLVFKKNAIIRPIYISNNKILNEKYSVS